MSAVTSALVHQIEQALADIEAARAEYAAGLAEEERLNDPALGTRAYEQWEDCQLEFAAAAEALLTEVLPHLRPATHGTACAQCQRVEDDGACSPQRQLLAQQLPQALQVGGD